MSARIVSSTDPACVIVTFTEADEGVELRVYEAADFDVRIGEVREGANPLHAVRHVPLTEIDDVVSDLAARFDAEEV